MNETRTRKGREDSVAVLTLPQFLRVATEGEVAAASLDEGAKRILEPGNEQPVSALERAVAEILTKGARDIREFLREKRHVAPASSANGYGGA